MVVDGRKPEQPPVERSDARLTQRAHVRRASLLLLRWRSSERKKAQATFELTACSPRATRMAGGWVVMRSVG